jgi:hypothetical protein
MPYRADVGIVLHPVEGFVEDAAYRIQSVPNCELPKGITGPKSPKFCSHVWHSVSERG